MYGIIEDGDRARLVNRGFGINPPSRGASKSFSSDLDAATPPRLPSPVPRQLIAPQGYDVNTLLSNRRWWDRIGAWVPYSPRGQELSLYCLLVFGASLL